MNTQLNREITSEIKKRLFSGRIIIIYGARRVGKTTLVNQLLEEYPGKYLNCEEPFVQSAFASANSSQDLRQFLGAGNFFVLDEAQTIQNIGNSLKLLIDTYPEIQIVATGSSSFDLSNGVGEPLTGRKYEFTLHPFSYQEIVNNAGSHEAQMRIDDMMKYGSYPQVVVKDFLDVEVDLREISSSYLFKDLLMFQNIRNSQVIVKLLQALALQIGQEVSYNELANLLDLDKGTVMRYIDLLEKTFVIFQLKPLSRNLRKELGKMRKIYFCDLGIRNALINQFNDINLRSDAGALWENFCILERRKYLASKNIVKNTYFWRTYDQKEIDYIEESDGKFSAFEIKMKDQNYKIPDEFINAYDIDESKVITKNNFAEFVI